MTLRLTAGMYHRFHAPHDCQVEQVTYISGDTWNVNPIAVQRIENLFCKNERAVIRLKLEPSGHIVTLVPVAAILVASIRLNFLNVLLHLRYRGPNHIPCTAKLKRGEEMGWFQHGSTIIAFVPPGVRLAEGLVAGSTVRMGQALFKLDTAHELNRPLAVITGTTHGIGTVTSHALARGGYDLAMLCRNVGARDRIGAQIMQRAPGSQVAGRALRPGGPVQRARGGARSCWPVTGTSID